jgi:hypothetical protein
METPEAEAMGPLPWALDAVEVGNLMIRLSGGDEWVSYRPLRGRTSRTMHHRNIPPGRWRRRDRTVTG